MAEMIERKNRCFTHYSRHILDYDLAGTEDNYHLPVVATPDMDSKEAE